MILPNIGFSAIIYFLFIQIAESAGPIKNFPELINWRDGILDEANYIETSFSDVINDQESIIYWTGRDKYKKIDMKLKQSILVSRDLLYGNYVMLWTLI